MAELDSARERAQLAELRTRIDGLKSLASAVRDQIAAEEVAVNSAMNTAQIAEEEAKAFSNRASASARHAEQEVSRLKRLATGGLISERELQRGTTDAAETSSDLDRRMIAVRRTREEQITQQHDRRAKIRGLHARLQETVGETANTLAAVSHTEAQISRLSIRAPIPGRIVEAAVLRRGSVVEAGQRLGAIVPDGKPVVAAWFAPAAAAGRVRPGQHAVLRLDGYTWTQYGTVGAIVDRVAGELRDNKLRVDLIVEARDNQRIPLQHGMPGSIEIEVERVSPLVLLGRHVGVMMTRATSAREALP